MDLAGSATLPAGPEEVGPWIMDLATYPLWLGIVLAAAPAGPLEGDAGPAWLVDLGARLGPLRRTKRVRMVRTVDTSPTGDSLPTVDALPTVVLTDGGASPAGAVDHVRHVRFERREGDGRVHGEWVLDATLRPAAGAAGGEVPCTELTMGLHYAGGAWVALLEPILAGEIRRAGGRLARCVAGGRPPTAPAR